MSLTPQEAAVIGEEELDRWQEAHAAIVQEIERSRFDFTHDRKLARQLTSELVAATRDEDKAALASDEAVAHGLTRLRKGQTEELESLEEQPYFARVVTEEESRQVEFRLGTASFPDQRIIDWRKAPISTLYYDYREGDWFDETIQGRDREGFIKLRRSYEGKKSELHIIETSGGTLYRQNGGWKIGDSGEPLSRSREHDGHLPPILSLITSEQFRMITRDPTKPIIIQGIAGSGKTTVALHRLAWLLHEDNSQARPEKCLVVMFNRSLKTYIETTLPELNIHNVPIRTFHQWAHSLVTEIAGLPPVGVFKKSRELEQFKSSAVCLGLLLQYVEKNPLRDSKNFIADLFRFFSYASQQDLFWPQWTQVRQQLKEQAERQVCDPQQDDPLLLHLIFAEHGHYPVRSEKALGLCDHIVIDEAQDFGLVEIRALLNAVDQKRTVTIVGDISQKIVMGRNFDSWEELLRDAGFEETTPLSLTVSHRSTQEIMELATSLRKEGSENASLPAATRHGPEPVFYRCDSPEVLTPTIGQWIKARTEENPKALCAVICRLPKEAERLVEELRKSGLPSVRLGHRDQFDFSPGVTITNAHQVKGLEFRNVLIVEPSEKNYSSTSEEERNLLYVATTRAELRLDFIGAAAPSKLLPEIMRGVLG
ncbi:MAG: AAA family ATPase [Deltaproteobacteria bacterium]|nr:AAA family ATPase [Deltaproteobacteria bacterium]